MRGAACYFHNHAFLTRFGLFIVIEMLSIVPTLEFLFWRKGPGWPEGSSTAICRCDT